MRLRVNRRGDWLLVRISTDEGLTGIGEASHGGHGPGRDALVAAILERQCLPRLQGRDPCAVVAATAALQGLVEGAAAATAVGGERLYGVGGYWPYLAAGVWDVIMPDVKHCGGMAALIAIARTADARGVAVSPHNPSGPVANMASAHVTAALPHLRALEYAWGEVPWRAEVITPPECIEAGKLVLPAGPGLGITLDETTLTQYRSSEATSS